MKLRISGDSLRFRLTGEEVRTLAEQGSIEERVRFGEGANLVYSLRLDPAAASITASYAGGAIDIRLPQRAALAWCESVEDVTLAGTQPATSDTPLSIVVEKDFGTGG